MSGSHPHTTRVMLSRTSHDRLACFGMRAVFVCALCCVAIGCGHSKSSVPPASTPSAPPAATDVALHAPTAENELPRAAIELEVDTALVRQLGWISPPEAREGHDSLAVEDELASITAWIAPVWDQLERIQLRVVPRQRELELHLLCTFKDPDAAEGAARMLHGLAAMWASRIERNGEGGQLAARALFAVRVALHEKVATATVALPPAQAARVLAWLTQD